MEYPPRCSECNRVVHVGAATDNKWLCEYCQIIADFKGADTTLQSASNSNAGTRASAKATAYRMGTR